MPIFTIAPAPIVPRGPDFKISRGDRYPSIEMVVENFVAPLPQSLVVKFIIRPHSGGAARVLDGVVLDYNAKIVAYRWANGDTSEVGDYWGQFILDFGGGARITLPPNNGDEQNPEYLWIRVNETLI